MNPKKIVKTVSDCIVSLDLSRIRKVGHRLSYEFTTC